MYVPTTEELVERCRNAPRGDTWAFEMLVRVFKDRIYATAYRMLSDPNDAEDVAQEVFLKVYRNIKSLSDPSSFTSWIYTITGNACLDALNRRKSRKADVPLTYSEDEPEDEHFADTKGTTPEEAAEQSELRQCLEEALRELDASSRSVIVLRDVEDRPYQEIANGLKVGLSAIKMRIQRARIAFRLALQKVCPDAWQATGTN